MVNKTLIVGYGNVDRQDDGIAWHVLAGLHQKLGRQTPAEPEDGFEFTGSNPEFMYALQLSPEMAETVAEFESVCFVDAHTANISADLQVLPLQAEFQNSPFTHHMTPETLLSFCRTLYGRSPDAILVSVRGFEFGFSRSLSPGSERLAGQAIQTIWKWLEVGTKDDE